MSKHVDSTKKHKAQSILSLCSGSLGLERGIAAVTPVKTVAYVEIEAFQIFNLVSAMEASLVDTAPIWTDIKTFDAKPFCRKVDILTAGFPCQPFSIAGTRKGTEDKRHVFDHIIRIAKECKPPEIFLENVPGIITALTLDFAPNFKKRVELYLKGTRQRMGKTLAQGVWHRVLILYGRPVLWYVLSSLEKIGYRASWGLYSAQEVGATHIRQRVFILAYSCSNTARWKAQSGVSIDAYKCGKGIQKERSSVANSNVKRLQRRKFTRRQESEIPLPSGICNAAMANTNGVRSFESNEGSAATKSNENGSKWPSPPGYVQHEWEEPRTVKSGMGSTINGYDFRTELLRMYGNAVVWQTAAKAYRELKEKIIYNEKGTSVHQK